MQCVTGLIVAALSMAAGQDDKPVFLQRSGSDLHLGGRPLRLVAVNKFDLFLSFLEGGGRKQQATAAIRQAGQLGFTAIRFAGVGFYPSHMRAWPNQKVYWGAFDELVKTAEEHSVRLIPVIHWNTHLFPDMAGECVQDMILNPDSRSRQYLWLYTHQIVSRYKDEPTILFWELTNEMNLGADLEFQYPYVHSGANPVHEGTAYMRLRRDNFTTDQMIPFTKSWAEFIRSIDRNHLISSGFGSPRAAAQHLRQAPGNGDWPPASEEAAGTWQRAAHPDPIDILSIHFYREHDTVRFGIRDEKSVVALSVFKRLSEKIGKPLFIGETGDEYATQPGAPFLNDVLDEVVRLGVSLTLVWNWMSPNDPHDVSPERTPQVVDLMRRANGRLWRR